MYYTRTQLGKIYFYAKVWKVSLENTATWKKILDFQFEPVCAKQTHPNYTVGSDQDEAETKYD